MKTIGNYFDEAVKITGSDRQTAIRMGITPNRISMARNSGSMSNEFCALLAEVINVSVLEIIAAAEVKKHPEKRDMWKKWVAVFLLSATVWSRLAQTTSEYILC